jgi:small subunit ribosomal protein S16
MLKIRLARTGRHNLPSFRVVVAEHKRQPKGRFVEVLGWYNPTHPNKPFSVDKEKVEEWIKKGAQPSNTVAKLLNKNENFSLPVETRMRKPKKAVEEAPTPVAAAPAAEEAADEAPAEVAEPVSETPVAEEASAPEAPAEAPAADEAPAAEAVPDAPAE